MWHGHCLKILLKPLCSFSGNYLILIRKTPLKMPHLPSPQMNHVPFSPIHYRLKMKHTLCMSTYNMPTVRHQQQRQKEVGVQQTTAMVTPVTWTQTPRNIYTPLSIPQTCGSVPRVHRGHPAKVVSRGAAWRQNLGTGGRSKTSFTPALIQRRA